jgi:hypothetical protein
VLPHQMQGAWYLHMSQKLGDNQAWDEILAPR